MLLFNFQVALFQPHEGLLVMVSHLQLLYQTENVIVIQHDEVQEVQ